MGHLALRGIRKSYGDVPVIHGVDLEVCDGEFLVFVGPSGCGKSTMLRMIAGLESITEGDLLIDGVRANDLRPADRGAAMVFQSYALYPHMTVAENMGFSLRMAGVKKSEREATVQRTADVLRITHLLPRLPKQLSGGERQRVAIGRAIVRKPKVFLFDEPLSNLDAKLRVAMRAEISKLHHRLGATMIYVTHDQVEAMTMADRIFIMNRGVVQQSGVPMEVYAQPVNRFVAGFIGSPAMNFFDSRLVTEADQLFIDGGSFRVAMPEAFRANLVAHVGKEVVFGVRPEDIALHQPGAESGSTISAKAEVVELLGSEIFAHLSCDAHALVARMAVPKRPISVGETIQIDFKMANTHVFDKNTSDVIV